MKRMKARHVNEENFTRGGDAYKKLGLGQQRLYNFWEWLSPEDRYDSEDSYLIVYSYKNHGFNVDGEEGGKMPSKFQSIVDNWEELYNASPDFQKDTSEYGKIQIEEDDPDYEGDPDLLIYTDKWTKEWNEEN